MYTPFDMCQICVFGIRIKRQLKFGEPAGDHTVYACASSLLTSRMINSAGSTQMILPNHYYLHAAALFPSAVLILTDLFLSS